MLKYKYAFWGGMFAVSKNNKEKKLCVSSLVLGILGLVFSLFVPAVAYACSIPGLVSGIRKSRRDYRASAGIVLNIIALSLALVNSILGVVMTIRIFFSDGKKEKEQ